MKIAIIGHGIVGQAMEELLKEHYEIIIHDPVKYKLKGVDILDQQVKINDECELAIICVPTPMAEDGSCNTEIVDVTLKWLRTPLNLIKSTVRPGFTKQHKNTVFSPEYIGESTYYNPYYKTMKDINFIIFGGDKKDTKKCIDIFKPVLGPVVQYFQTDSTSAEIVKYMENCFFATKIMFCNEFFDICEAMGSDYEEVREMWLADKRINRMHTSVFKDNRGFSGKCLPKDLSAIIEQAKKDGYVPKLLKQIKKSNEEL